MSDKHSHMHVVNAVAIREVGTCVVTDTVRTVRPEPVVGLALIGPIYGTIPLFGDDAPDVQASVLVNAEHAAMLIAHLVERFEAEGQGPALTAHVDQFRPSIRERIAQEARNG